MRKTLLATTAVAAAGAFAAGPALSADMLSVGVGGYMQQWFGAASVDDSDNDIEGGIAQQSDSEIHFKGKLEADNGLTFSVKVELEGNSRNTGNRDGTGSHNHSTSYIDESQLTVSGAFGQIVLGAEDPASTLTHHGNKDVGVTLNCGDSHKWIQDDTGCSHDGFGTAGHGHGDRNSISYYSPRMNGVQFGATYIPNRSQEGEFWTLNDNETDAWSIGGNYVGDFGGANIAVSLGHYQASQTHATLKRDDKTFSNFGLQVGFGAFGFDVAYAENDGGQYMANGMKNEGSDWETMSAGVIYTDGPMAVSLSHMGAEDGEGDNKNTTMLSLSYTLAPGVDSKTSIFGTEVNSGSGSDKRTIEGSAFVTGFVIGF